MRKVEKMKITELLHLIVELTDPSMSRMEAWKAVAAEVPQLDWESFKRIQPLAERPEAPRRSLAVLLTKIGNVLATRGDFAKAERYLSRSIAVSEAEDGSSDLVLICLLYTSDAADD